MYVYMYVCIHVCIYIYIYINVCASSAASIQVRDVAPGMAHVLRTFKIWRAFLGKQFTGTAYGPHRSNVPGPGIVVIGTDASFMEPLPWANSTGAFIRRAMACALSRGWRTFDSRTAAYVRDLDAIATQSRELNPLRSAGGAPSPTGEKRWRQQSNLQPRLRSGRTPFLCAQLEDNKIPWRQKFPRGIQSNLPALRQAQRIDEPIALAAQELKV